MSRPPPPPTPPHSRFCFPQLPPGGTCLLGTEGGELCVRHARPPVLAAGSSVGVRHLLPHRRVLAAGYAAAEAVDENHAGAHVPLAAAAGRLALRRVGGGSGGSASGGLSRYTREKVQALSSRMFTCMRTRLYLRQEALGR